MSCRHLQHEDNQDLQKLHSVYNNGNYTYISRFISLHRVLQRVHAGHAVVAAHVPRPQQVASIAVEWAVRGAVTHERQYGLAHRVQRPCWCPARFQNVQAYLARLWRGWVDAPHTCVSRAP